MLEQVVHQQHSLPLDSGSTGSLDPIVRNPLMLSGLCAPDLRQRRGLKDQAGQRQCLLLPAGPGQPWEGGPVGKATTERG